MKMTKKKGFVLAAVVLLAAFGGYKMKQSAQVKTMAPAVTTSPITVKDLTETLSLSAPLEGTDSVDVASRLHYEVQELYVKEGDQVTKGQLIAKLDTSQIEREIAALQDNLKLLQVQYQEGEKNTDQAVALLDAQLEDTLKTRQKEYETALETKSQAERSLSQLKTLQEVGGASAEEVKEAETKLAQAQRDVDSYTVVNGQVQLTEQEKQQLENTASSSTATTAQSIQNAKNEIARKKADLADCQIVSSIDGTITRMYTKVGRFADDPTEDGKPMFVIENIDRLKMKVNVSEYDIAKVAVGQDVTVEADILAGETVHGTVTNISPTGEAKSGSSERVIPVEITLDADTKNLIAGINAKAVIAVKEAEHALVAPVETVLDHLDGTYSVVRQNADGSLEDIPVTLGVENVLEIQLISDQLKDGDQSVCNPTMDLLQGGEDGNA